MQLAHTYWVLRLLRADWKQKVLSIIPPRLVVGAYRNILRCIHLSIPVRFKREEFTLQELEDEITSLARTLEQGHVVIVESERCLKILPQVIQKLVDAGLLVYKNGRYKKSKDFSDFWYITRQAHVSVEKMTRWSVYYLLANGKRSFSTDDLLHILTCSEVNMQDALPKLAVRTKTGWERLVEEHDGKWVVKLVPTSLTKPSAISDIYDKLLFAILTLSESDKTELTTSEIFGIVRSLEGESIRRVLRKLRFKEHNRFWEVPLDIQKQPELLIEKIEVPLRLRRGQVEYVCLSLLERNSLSLTELAEITGADKSTISRTLKRLMEDERVILTGKGPFGEIYLITNCNNCPFGTDKRECQDEVIKTIKKIMKHLGLATPQVDWQRFSNHALMKLATKLIQAKTEKTLKSDIKEYMELCSQVFRPLLSPMLETLEKRAVLMTDEHGWIDEVKIYSSIDEKGKGLPFLYFLGVKQALESDLVSTALELLTKERSKMQAPSRS